MCSTALKVVPSLRQPEASLLGPGPFSPADRSGSTSRQEGRVGWSKVSADVAREVPLSLLRRSGRGTPSVRLALRLAGSHQTGIFTMPHSYPDLAHDHET